MRSMSWICHELYAEQERCPASPILAYAVPDVSGPAGNGALKWRAP